jgi:dipeptidyl-peptidase-3
LPDAECVAVYPTASVLRNLTAVLRAPSPDQIEGDHLRAALLQLQFLRARGALHSERRQGKIYFVVRDCDRWRAAVAELLTELQRIKATGDRPAFVRLVEAYASCIDAALHAEVRARRPSQNLAEYIAIAPPILTPLRDGRGRVVDATATPPRELDDYVDAVERSS